MKQFLQAITKISEGEHEVLLVSSSRDVAGLKMDGALLKPSWMAIDREGKKHHEKTPGSSRRRARPTGRDRNRGSIGTRG
nr:hypothetical protein [Deltaproteobacteria bacterium]